METVRRKVFFNHSPYGSQAGDPFDDKAYTGIRKITIVVVSSIIESIKVDYDQNGSFISSRRHGGALAREGQTFVVRLNYPKEYLTSISGHMKGNTIDGVIQSLSMHSNEREYGPYGAPVGKHFSIVAKEGEMICGFVGRSGTHLNSIGEHTRPISAPFSKIGPFESSAHSNWNDGQHQNIRQIVVEFDSKIRRIGIIYDNYGYPVGPFPHGKRTEGTEVQCVDLAYPNEYLTSISGYIKKESIDTVTLQSLTFHSNVRDYGPYGTQDGSHFSDPKEAGFKILGFNGRYIKGEHESIGAYVKPVSDIYPYERIGPFGGDGGNPWDDGKYIELRKIRIEWDVWIDSVSFVYGHEGQADVETSRHGGAGNANACTVDLDADEYIIRMSGYHDRGDNKDHDIIKSLTFESNKRKLGPYGNQEGAFFSSSPNVGNIGKLVGFYGSCSNEYLISIGAYCAHNFDKHPLKKIGPFGLEDGESWDDGKYSGIRGIEISCGEVIDSIGFVYDDNGEPSQVTRRGGTDGYPKTVVLDYPNEYILSISGRVGRYEDHAAISSITFQTNYTSYGPYGDKNEGEPFSFRSNIGKFVGFYGRSDRFLKSIGAYVELLPCNGASPSQNNGASSI